MDSNQSHYFCLRTKEVRGNRTFHFLHARTSGRNLDVSPNISIIFFLLINLFYVNGYFGCMYIYVSCLSVVPVGVRREHQGVWNWSCRQTWVSHHVCAGKGPWVLSHLSRPVHVFCMSEFVIFSALEPRSGHQGWLRHWVCPGERHLSSSCTHTYSCHWLRKNRVSSVSPVSY